MFTSATSSTVDSSTNATPAEFLADHGRFERREQQPRTIAAGDLHRHAAVTGDVVQRGATAIPDAPSAPSNPAVRRDLARRDLVERHRLAEQTKPHREFPIVDGDGQRAEQ